MNSWRTWQHSYTTHSGESRTGGGLQRNPRYAQHGSALLERARRLPKGPLLQVFYYSSTETIGLTLHAGDLATSHAVIAQGAVMDENSESLLAIVVCGVD